MKKQTLTIHAGESPETHQGSVSMPIYQSSTYLMDSPEDYHRIRYLRLNNSPNHETVHKKIAALESAPAALVLASGMAVISSSLMSLLNHGDHVLAQNNLYGGTDSLLREDLPKMGVSHSFIDLHRPDSWKEMLKPNTRLIYVESMTNPLLKVGELEEVVKFARQNDLFTLVDNTFPTPVLFRPLEMGFDLSLHSATKALNGHSDICAGAIAGSEELIDKIRHKANHLGGNLDPHSCFLLNRGLKTLHLRVDKQCENAMAVAEFLHEQKVVKKVLYPGLHSHPDHDRANKWFEGKYGGVVSFQMKGGIEAAEKLIRKLKLFHLAPSLGGVESLVCRPATSSHAGLSAEDLQRAGFESDLIRLSLGIEDSEDLIDDLTQAMS